MPAWMPASTYQKVALRWMLPEGEETLKVRDTVPLLVIHLSRTDSCCSLEAGPMGSQEICGTRKRKRGPMGQMLPWMGRGLGFSLSLFPQWGKTYPSTVYPINSKCNGSASRGEQSDVLGNDSPMAQWLKCFSKKQDKQVQNLLVEKGLRAGP